MNELNELKINGVMHKITAQPDPTLAATVQGHTEQLVDHGERITALEELVVIEQSANLVDFEKMTLGKAMDAFTGELVDKANYGVSDFIPVEYGKSYIGMVYYNETQQATWAGQAILFNSNKEYISRAVTRVSNGLTIDQPEVAYVRVEFNMSYGTQQAYFAEGTSVPDAFEPYANNKKIKPEMFDVTDDSIPDNTISPEKLKCVDVDKLIPFVLAENLCNPNTRVDGKRWVNGVLTDVVGYSVSANIDVEPNTIYSVGVIHNDTWYYDAVRGVACFDVDGKWIGQLTVSTGNFTTMGDTRFISLVIQTAGDATFANKTCLVKGDQLPIAFVPYSGRTHRLHPEYTPHISKYLTAWEGKKMVSYGDSITQQNLWQPNVRHYFGMVHENKGVSAAGFVRGAQYYYANPDGSRHSTYTTGSTAPEGTIKCEAGFCSDQRINLSIPTDADLIIIMGGTNDHGGDAVDVPDIGDITYTVDGDNVTFDTSNFKGAVCATVYKIMKRCPNAIVMLATPPNTRCDGNKPIINGKGLILSDYVEAIKDCAKFMSVPCIDVFGESGINPFNHSAYTQDGLHPNDVGARMMSRVVIAMLKGYEIRKSIFD